ncbi:MAG: TIGR00266 family protein, partial [Myxococcota bacterium]
MRIEVEAKPSYAMAVVTLEKGEKIVAESSSMVAMSSGLAVETTFNGAQGGDLVAWLTAAFVGLARRFFAGETMFVNEFRAKADGQQVMLAPAMVGDLTHVTLDGARKVVVQASSFVACTPGVKQKLIWGGIAMLFSGEGAFFLECSGKGELLFNSYGGLELIELDGPYVVDSGHVAAWEGEVTYT